MSLSPEQIDAIRQGANILEVVGAELTLKKQGQRFVGLCPFHQEKTPSFSVNPDKGLYYCFGCHAGGDVFSFVMRHRGLEFHEAARLLAERAGVELARESPEVQRRKKAEQEIERVNRYALAYFTHGLWSEEGRRARQVLGERGVPQKQAEQFQLGFGGLGLLEYLGAKRVPPALIHRAGLLTEDRRRGLFDQRLIFPIFDAAGRLVGFGGRRILTEQGPKYVNSPQTPLFVKRRLLFGWNFAEESIRRLRRVVVVEGFMDVLAAHRSGVTDAVAALGTSFSPEHAKACGRLAKEAVLLFDADDAGARAAESAARALLEAGLRVLVAPLPPGEDPDSLARKAGNNALQSVLDGAQVAMEYFMARAFADANTIEARSRAAEGLAPLLFALPSGLERDLYTARLAAQVGIDAAQMGRHLQEAVRQRTRPAGRDVGDKRRDLRGSAPGDSREWGRPGGGGRPKGGGCEPSSRVHPPDSSPVGGAAFGEPPPATEAPPRPTRFEMRSLAEVLLHPSLRPRLGLLAEFTSDPMRLLLDDLAESRDPVEEVLERHLPPSWVKKLLERGVSGGGDGNSPVAGSENDAEAQAERTFADVLSRLKGRHLENARREVLKELEEAESRGEPTDELVRTLGNLTRRKKELTRPHPAS